MRVDLGRIKDNLGESDDVNAVDNGLGHVAVIGNNKTIFFNHRRIRITRKISI